MVPGRTARTTFTERVFLESLIELVSFDYPVSEMVKWQGIIARDLIPHLCPDQVCDLSELLSVAPVGSMKFAQLFRILVESEEIHVGLGNMNLKCPMVDKWRGGLLVKDISNKDIMGLRCFPPSSVSCRPTTTNSIHRRSTLHLDENSGSSLEVLVSSHHAMKPRRPRRPSWRLWAALSGFGVAATETSWQRAAWCEAWRISEV